MQVEEGNSPCRQKLSVLTILNGSHATRTQRRMIGVFANIRFPMPATLAFLAVGFGDCDIEVTDPQKSLGGRALTNGSMETRNIQQFLQIFDKMSA